jgi:hypothetical protein
MSFLDLSLEEVALFSITAESWIKKACFSSYRLLFSRAFPVRVLFQRRTSPVS